MRFIVTTTNPTLLPEVETLQQALDEALAEFKQPLFDIDLDIHKQVNDSYKNLTGQHRKEQGDATR